MDPGRILFADDTVEFRRPMAVALERAGFEVTTVGDAASALTAIETAEYDVLITDIYMPGNHDLQLLRTVDGKTPVIVVTGSPSVPTAVEALRRAAFDYLVKPIEPSELAQRVHAAVAKARAMRSLRATKERVASMAEQLAALETAFEGSGEPPPLERSAETPLAGLCDADRDLLSPREIEVVAALARGNRVSEVAAALFISPHTVRNHLKSIFRKLNVSSQVGLLARLRRS